VVVRVRSASQLVAGDNPEQPASAAAKAGTPAAGWREVLLTRAMRESEN
jgi:hypothetical protein